MKVRSRQSKVIASILAASMLASCSPKVNSKSYPKAKMVFETSQVDTNLAIKEVNPDELLKHLTADQQMKTGDLFRSIGALYSLAESNQSPELKILADGINHQFYSSVNTTAKVRFENSPVVLAALGYGKGYIDLLTKLLNLIEGSVKTYPWPKDIKFEDYEVESQRYVSWLIEEVRAELATKNIQITDKMVASGEAAINEQIANRQTGLQESIDDLKASESVEMLLSNLSDFISDSLMIDLESSSLAELQQLLTSVAAVGLKVDAITNKKTAASALTAAKKVLSEDQMKLVDVAAAPELVKAGLTQALAATLLEEVEQAASTHGFPQLPNQLLALGAMGVGLEPEQVKEIARNPKATLKKLAAQFGEAQLASAPAGITGVESDEIDLVFHSSSLKVVGKRTNALKTSAEAIGASLSNSIATVIEADKQIKASEKQPQNEETQAQLEQKKKETNTLVLSQLNKLILLSGFKTEDDKIASYTTIQDNAGTPLELLNEKASSMKGAAVSDSVVISKNLTPISTANSISVRGQAALLQGLSDTISYLRDWKQNGFDKGLGQVTIAQLLGSDATEGPLAKPAFDKSMLFTLAIGNAGTILTSIQKESTPFYLIGPRDSALWLNEPQPRNSKGDVVDSRVTAGIVDIVKGKRTSFTKTGDIARYILAIISFLEATDGLEKTKSALLTEKDPETGISKLELLLGGRASLTKLLTVLTNMISGTLQQPDGSLAAQFNKDTRELLGKASAVDTALAIEALVKVGNLYDANAYRTAALEAYFAMNRNHWNKKLQFYSQGKGKGQTPSYSDLVSILNSVETLAPHMPSESRAQWTAITKNWVGALELLANTLKNAKN